MHIVVFGSLHIPKIPEFPAGCLRTIIYPPIIDSSCKTAFRAKSFSACKEQVRFQAISWQSLQSSNQFFFSDPKAGNMEVFPPSFFEVYMP